MVTEPVYLGINNFAEKSLTLDTCRRIHFEALRNFSGVKVPDVHMDLSVYRHLENKAKRVGPEAYFLHPEEIREIFDHVTLGVYRHIEELYCTREERTIPMVTKIIDRVRHEKGLNPINPIAIWSICMFLVNKRAKVTEVTKFFEDKWFISKLNWNMNVLGIGNKMFQPSGFVVTCPQKEQVLSIRIAGREDISTELSMAVYEALLAKRVPSGDAAAGLIWSLPRKITSNVELDEKTNAFLSRMDIRWDVTSTNPLMLDNIQGDWEAGLDGRNLPVRNLQLILDRYLYRQFGFSPHSAQRLLKATYKKSAGLKRDPLWQFPDLRLLFNRQPVQVDEMGIIHVGRLSYTHNILPFWKNEVVEVIVSPTDRESAWIYEPNGDLICQATRYWRQ